MEAPGARLPLKHVQTPDPHTGFPEMSLALYANVTGNLKELRQKAWGRPWSVSELTQTSRSSQLSPPGGAGGHRAGPRLTQPRQSRAATPPNLEVTLCSGMQAPVRARAGEQSPVT